MRRLMLAVAGATVVAAMVASPAGAGKPDRTTITDTVIALSGASGFDSNGDDFDILREALVATDLVGKFDRKKKFTVFAPNDAAFLALTGAGSEEEAFNGVAALGLDNVEKVLRHHVTRGKRKANSVVPARRIRTINRDFLRKDRGSAVLRDGAGREVEIIAPNAAIVSNGVIHVVGDVLLPFALD